MWPSASGVSSLGSVLALQVARSPDPEVYSCLGFVLSRSISILFRLSLLPVSVVVPDPSPAPTPAVPDSPSESTVSEDDVVSVTSESSSHGRTFVLPSQPIVFPKFLQFPDLTVPSLPHPSPSADYKNLARLVLSKVKPPKF